MSYLSMVEAKLPPGFRFYPRDDELICDYLQPRAASGDGDNNLAFRFPMMIDVDINKCEPWDLPEVACVGGKEWYFYNLRDRKYATGQRTNRATLSGYWKATGKDRQIVRKGTVVGMRKTLVFYQGRAPKGKKTEWVMHEFRLEGRGDPLPKFSFKEDWVLCRVFYKSRGVGGMPCRPTAKESFYDDTGSSSLPSLTDTYITFDQTFPPLNSNVIGIATAFTTPTATFEQVPCFSNCPQFPSQHFVPPICDKKAIKSVLDHLSKLEANNHQMNRREDLAQASSQSYFSDAALSSSMWYFLQS